MSTSSISLPLYRAIPDRPTPINPSTPDQPNVVTPAAPDQPNASGPAPPVEPKPTIALTNDKPKAIISTGFLNVLRWHIWTLLSVGGTIVLLTLNFREYFIGEQLGFRGNSHDSANILGFLQIVVKAHELSIIASIVAIAEQYILRDLLSDGLLLGLLGSSGAIPSPSFLVSKRFWLAIKFGLQGIYSRKSTPAGLRTLRLVVVLFVFTVIAGLAGPSSAVLMIPRVDWFDVDHTSVTARPRSTIPTVLLGTAPVLIGNQAFVESNPFALPQYIVGCGMQYWFDISSNILRNSGLTLKQRSTHLFHDYLGLTYVNISGSLHRPLDGTWTGGTNVKAQVKPYVQLYKGDQFEFEDAAIVGDYSNFAWVYEAQVVNGSITCRARTKIPCPLNATEVSSFPDWCSRTVHTDPTMVGDLRFGRNLLMSQDLIDGQIYPRVWLTEGPRIQENQHYSDSIEVLFEKHSEDSSMKPNLTVCSFTANLVAATGNRYLSESLSTRFLYYDFAYSSNGTKLPPRKFLFYENWLDRAYSYDPTIWLTDSVANAPDLNKTLFTDGTDVEDFGWTIPSGAMVQPDNFTYPARPGLHPKINTFQFLGRSLSQAVDDSNFGDDGQEIEGAFTPESSVGGILTYMISLSQPSFSQYSMPYDQIPEKFRVGPAEAFQHPYSGTWLSKGYGFRLSNRTGRLGVAVLLMHAVIAVLASLRQWLRRTGIVQAWSTVPDYVCLGSGSPTLVESHPNTCAGLAGDGLCTVVRVMVTAKEDSKAHLEVLAVRDSGMAEAFAVDLRDDKQRYGFRETKLKQE